MMTSNANTISPSLRQTLDRVANRIADRKHEIVDLLREEHPEMSEHVATTFQHCIWWEGCYYCKGEDGEWQRVRCFM
ncbi:MAG TPA: hypothetical protein IGS37_14195 [Synechococcales cyanobacterium M55_K2018_004]|nr:hypothetical protein [Synechococcales cyanobacterium M55_K2018_004]